MTGKVTDNPDITEGLQAFAQAKLIQNPGQDNRTGLPGGLRPAPNDSIHADAV